MLKKLQLISLWIKEYSSPCRAQKRFIDRENIFYVCGHRGSPTVEVENTIASLDQAVKEGANSVEVDLSVTKDNEVILWHDWDPNGTATILREAGLEPFVKYKPSPPPIFSSMRKPVRELTLQELKENYNFVEKNGNSEPVKFEIAKLQDFFRWAKDKKKLVNVCFDIKPPGDESEYAVPIMDELKKLIAEFKPHYNFIIETTEPTVLKLLKKSYPEFPCCLDIEPPPGLILEPKEYSAVKAAIENKNLYAYSFRPRKITFANFTTYRRIIKYDVRLRAKHNKENPDKKIEMLLGGTVNKTKELRCLLKLGVGGIQTDFPSRLRKMAEKLNLRLE